MNTALRIITRPDPDCLTGKEKGLRIVLVLSAESEEELQMWQDILLAAKAEALQHAALASQFDWSLTFVFLCSLSGFPAAPARVQARQCDLCDVLCVIVTRRVCRHATATWWYS